MATPENAHKPTHDLVYEAAEYSDRVVVAKSKATQLQNISDGVATEAGLAWERWIEGDEKLNAALLRKVIIEMTGAATDFDWKIMTKSGATGVEIIASGTAVSSPLNQNFDPLEVWISEETGDGKGLMWVEVTPNGGAGSFAVRVYADPKR